MGYTLKDDEFALIIKPRMKRNGEWTGEVNMGMTFDPENGLPRDVQMSVVNIISVLSVVLDYLGENPDIQDEVIEYRNEIFEDFGKDDDDEEDVANVNESPRYSKSGNVFKLTRSTKTEGSA